MATPRLAVTRLLGCDGLPLRVDVRTAARPGERRAGIVICHGFKGFKDWGFFPKAAERLALAGFTAVSFNTSGCGVGEDGETFSELERWGHQTLTGDLRDLATVLDFAADLCGSVGLLGHSRGGGTAILTAARDTRVRSLVTWAAVSRFGRWSEEEIEQWRREGSIGVVNLRTGQVLPIYADFLADLDANGSSTLDVLAAAAAVRVPWLIAHGTDDETVPVDEARLLSRISGTGPAAGSSELLLVDGGSHTFGIRHPWAGSTPQFDLLLERTVAFFAAALH